MSGNDDLTLEAAAIKQLADELGESGIELLGDLVSKLKAGSATLIDFGSLDHIQATGRMKDKERERPQPAHVQ